MEGVLFKKAYKTQLLQQYNYGNTPPHYGAGGGYMPLAL